MGKDFSKKQNVTLFHSLWNLPTMPPSRASSEQSGLSLAFQSPAVSLRRCPHSVSYSLMRTRMWSWRSTRTWQWTPAPADNVSFYPFTHQTCPDLPVYPIPILHWIRDYIPVATWRWFNCISKNNCYMLSFKSEWNVWKKTSNLANLPTRLNTESFYDMAVMNF